LVGGFWAAAADLVPPETYLDTHPTDPSSSPDASFTFHSNDPEAVFECSLDSVPFEECDSPKDYTALTDGPHTFEVRAKDLSDNVDASPASFGWTIAHPAQLLTISKNGNGTVTSVPPGIDCGPTCVHAFAFNTSVELATAASPGWTFTGWSDGPCTGVDTCTLVMSEARSVTANFMQNLFRIYLPIVIK